MSIWRKEKEIAFLLKAIAEYKPGSTSENDSQRPTNPPSHLRIALFGPTGVGKSALINSLLYASGELWNHHAAEGFTTVSSKTTARHAFDIAEHITILDNRGLINLGGPFMAEVKKQLGGVYADNAEVIWEPGIVQRINKSLIYAFSVNKECEIQCAVLVVSAISPRLEAHDLQELIDTIKTVTGERPIVVITHINHPNVSDDALFKFKQSLSVMDVPYFVIENYTVSRHDYDVDKHLSALQILHRCTIVGDHVMKNKEQGSKCIIL